MKITSYFTFNQVRTILVEIKKQMIFLKQKMSGRELNTNPRHLKKYKSIIILFNQKRGVVLWLVLWNAEADALP